MTLLQNALHKILTQRLPLVPTIRNRGFSLGGLGLATGQAAQMEAYATIGTLFGVVSRICEAVAATEWVLYDTRGAEKREITSHPFLDLWSHINDHWTRYFFLEGLQQHQELVGESYILPVGPKGRPPLELFFVRPDRITPIPNPNKYLAGYIYQIGAERIPLEVDDVISLLHPDPRNPYRGLGPVQALLIDLQSERAAAQWTAMFFKNGAAPGGYIEFPEKLSDSDFEMFVQRWREQHQGISNAHRVAVLEGAKWVDSKYSQRDMQYDQLRKLTKDLILYAFGFPQHLLGVAESVNRANAEAAEVMFSRWVLRPRLERIVGAINERLLPRYGPNLLLGYVDPVPENRELNLQVGIQGYDKRILTKNEARALLGHDTVPDGDDFAAEPQPPPQLIPAPDDIDEDEKLTRRKALELRPPEEQAEQSMERNWSKRLNREAKAIIAYLEAKMVKIEPGDIATYSWDWWDKYGDDVIAELVVAFEAAALTAEPGVQPNILQIRAREFAERRAAELLQLSGDINLMEFTRERVRLLITQALENGWGLGQLSKAIQNDVAFAASRATMIARTETAIALGQGAKQASIAQGRTEKHWVTAGAIDFCADNEAQGWLGIGDAFTSGHDTIPGHPNCKCNVRYRTPPLVELDSVAEARCPSCNQLFGFDVREARFTCQKRHPMIEMVIKEGKIINA